MVSSGMADEEQRRKIEALAKRIGEIGATMEKRAAEPTKADQKDQKDQANQTVDKD